MKAVRILLLIFFLITAGIYTGVTVRARLEADNTPPVITADEEAITVIVSATEEELLQGMHAEDDTDGDVTKSLIVVSMDDFTVKGTRKVNYAAFDSHNNVATFSRKITYSDYRSPRFSSPAPFRYVYGNRTDNLFSKVTVEDVIDGNISMNIRYITGEISEDGTEYPVIFQVTNSAGDTASVSVTMHRQDTSAFSVPIPALSEYIVYSKVGEDIDLSQYVVGYYKGSNLFLFEEMENVKDPEYTVSDITRDASGVDITTPGEYIVTFQLHGEDKEMGQTELYWIVEE